MPDGAPFRIYLDRRRELLVTRGDPRPLGRELELHHLASAIEYDAFTAGLVRRGLYAIALYMLSRPRFETLGWTVNIQEPRRNLFLAGSAGDGTVIGRAFVENVQPAPRNLFYAQTCRSFGDPQTSYVEVEGTDIYRIVEQFCRMSDQQPVRFFTRSEEDVALASVLPDADPEMLESIDPDVVFGLPGEKDVKLIGERSIRLLCGCDTGRITKILVTLYQDEPEELFRGDEAIEAECPRCGAKHIVSRAMFDAALEAGRSGG